MLRTYDPVEGVASAQALDVSDFQGAYDWARAARTYPGLAAGIYRVTQGLGAPGTVSPDPDATWNHREIRACGLHRGAYHFLDPTLSGAAQARYFVDTLAKIGLVDQDMLWLDSETVGASPAATSACAAAFMAELHTLRPHNPKGVYTYIDFATTGHCQGLGRWPLWLAYPASTAPVPPPPWARWTWWQWGLRNGVDADGFNGTRTALDAWIASFQPPPAPAPGPPYRHTTDGKTTLAGYATSRHMTVEGFLAEQARLYTQLGMLAGPALAALGKAVPPAGLTYFTTHPS